MTRAQYNKMAGSLIFKDFLNSLSKFSQAGTAKENAQKCAETMAQTLSIDIELTTKFMQRFTK